MATARGRAQGRRQREQVGSGRTWRHAAIVSTPQRDVAGEALESPPRARHDFSRVQQRQGRVRPTRRVFGLSVNDDARLEAEANRLAARPVPGDSPALAPHQRGTPPMAPLQFAGWNIDQFKDKVEEEGLAGLCDALSSAWLAGFLEPDEATAGIDETNFPQIVALKLLLFRILEATGADSGLLTPVFVRYIEDNDLDATWFTELTTDQVPARVSSFLDYLVSGQGEFDWDEGLGEETIARTAYANVTAALGERTDALLEPFFDLRSSFTGLTVIHAFTADGYVATHQFALRYEPAGTRGVFSILDQTTGLFRHNVASQEEIVEVLCHHVNTYYVENPMSAGDEPTVTAEVKVRLRPAPGHE